MLGDQVYMARVTPTVEDIADKSKWCAPRTLEFGVAKAVRLACLARRIVAEGGS